MNDINFDELPDQQKALYLSEFGVELIRTQMFFHDVYLFSLGGYFVEAIVNKESRKVNIQLANYSNLDKHLHDIDITGLFE